MKLMHVLALAVSAALLPTACSTQQSPSAKPELIPLSIRTASGTVHKFRVEVAATPEEQERGLMFRESLPEDGGMIFPFPTPRVASFWMRNTLIPLDMIFIRADGSIARIAAETTPHSLEPVTAGEPVTAVLEVAGGKSAKLGISEDDTVSWPH